VQGYDLLIVKSQPSPMYDEVLRGLHSVRKFSERVITLSDYSEVDIKRIVKEDSPALVVTLGDLALESARKVKHLTVIPLMAISYQRNAANQSNIRGIEVLIAPERYLALFRQLTTHRVGVLYSKDKTGAYLQRAQRVASKFGLVLVPREVTSPKEVFAQLESLKGSVDALWMLPDSAVISQLTLEGFANFSIDQKVPLVSYAGVYLSHGASVVVEIDRSDLGIQAGEMIVDLLAGGSLTAESTPRKALLRLNPSIMKRLGISTELAGKIQANGE
jgi:putative ABC transport system substrate-binding protein